MKITENWLNHKIKEALVSEESKQYNDYFKKHKDLFDLDSSKVAKKLIKDGEIDKAAWIIAHSLNKVEKLNLAILIGEKVLPVYEKMYKDETLPREVIDLMKQYRRYLSKNNNIINLDVYEKNYSKLLSNHDEYIEDILSDAFHNTDKSKDFFKAKEALVAIEAIDSLFGRDNIKNEGVKELEITDGEAISAAIVISRNCVDKSDFDDIIKFTLNLLEKNESKELSSKNL